MRILLVSSATQTSRTGVTAHYNRLLTHLSERVESVELITPADAPFWTKKILRALRRLANWMGPSSRAMFLELENFLSIWASVRQRGAQAFDLVHAQDATSGAAAAWGLSRKVPVVVTCHFNDDPVTEYQEQYRLRNWAVRYLNNWYQHLFRQVDEFITVSNYTRTVAARRLPAQRPCAVIHNGVLFPSVSARPTEGPLIIVNIGTVEKRKNQRLLIETASELRNRGFTNFQVWLLGDGPKRKDWKTLILAKNLEGYVTFLGYKPNVDEFLKRASLYVHTAVNESWGYTITEAMAAGTPVLALGTGGIPEQFDKPGPGLLPATTSATELADAIMSYRSANARQQLADRQRAFAQERFRLDIMIDRHLSLYQTLIGREEVAYVAESTVAYNA